MNTPFKPYKLFSIYWDNNAWYCEVIRRFSNGTRTRVVYGPYASQAEARKRAVKLGVMTYDVC